jgi:hypothetical protein
MRIGINGAKRNLRMGMEPLEEGYTWEGREGKEDNMNQGLC